MEGNGAQGRNRTTDTRIFNPPIHFYFINKNKRILSAWTKVQKFCKSATDMPSGGLGSSAGYSRFQEFELHELGLSLSLGGSRLTVAYNPR